MNCGTGHDEDGLVNVYVLCYGIAVFIFNVYSSGDRKRTIRPAVKNESAVRFDADAFIAHIYL